MLENRFDVPFTHLQMAQDCVSVHCDGRRYIHMSKHQVYYDKSYHDDMKFHFIKDVIDCKKVLIKKVATEDNPFDVFTLLEKDEIPTEISMEYYHISAIFVIVLCFFLLFTH
jgi:hypothetical protein